MPLTKTGLKKQARRQLRWQRAMGNGNWRVFDKMLVTQKQHHEERFIGVICRCGKTYFPGRKGSDGWYPGGPQGCCGTRLRCAYRRRKPGSAMSLASFRRHIKA